jgi:hypothetical protein
MPLPFWESWGLPRVVPLPHPHERQVGFDACAWATAIELEPSGHGTRSLRRTNAVEIYRKIGKFRAMQLLLGDAKFDSTLRYLGVGLKGASSLSECIDI